MSADTVSSPTLGALLRPTVVLVVAAGGATLMAGGLDATTFSSSEGRAEAALAILVEGVTALLVYTGALMLIAPKLAAQSHDLGTRIMALEQEAYELAGQPFNLGSPKQIGEIFFTKLGLPPGRESNRRVLAVLAYVDNQRATSLHG